MRPSTSHRSKQQQYINKFKLIDQHIAKTTRSQALGLDFNEMYQLMAGKSAPDPPQELPPFTTKIIQFENKQIRRFTVKEVSAERGKAYVLNVNSQAPAKISITVNQGKPKFYSIKGTKGIIIPETTWKMLLVTVQMEKAGMFSSVKLYLDIMTVDHKNQKKGNVNLRPNITQELEEYLKANRGRSAQIIKSRSMARLRESVARRNIATAGSLVGRSRAVSSEMVRTKSQLFKFQKQKQFYIRNVERMSPQKMKQLKEAESDYHKSRRIQMANLARLVLIAKIGLYIRDHAVLYHRQRIKEIKLNFLCIDFIKIIKNKFRLKMTQKARLRMVNLHYVHTMPAILYESSNKKARKTLLQGLMPYMEFRGLQEVSENSEEYLRSLKKLQQFFRKKRQEFKQRIRTIVERLCVLYHIELVEKEREKIIETYLVQCLKHNRFNFYARKDRLLQMLREAAKC